MFEIVASILVLIAVALISLVLTRLMIRWGPRLGLIDEPDARRIHTRAIPRAGGLAVYLAMLTGFTVLAVTGLAFRESLGLPWLLHFVVGSLLLVGVGILDDRGGISAWLKLGAQVTAAFILVLGAPHGFGNIYGIEVPWLVDVGVHVAWVVLLINAFNLIDGMDGLCAGLGSIALLIMAGLSAAMGKWTDALIISVVVAALLGFLRYNFHPARIFLGDTGSMLVGLFIAAAGTETVGRTAVAAGLLLPLLVAGVPLADVGLAVWRRVMRRIAVSKPGQAAVRVFDPDRDHLHHRLLDWGLSQRQAAVLLYAVAGVVGLFALVPVIGGASLAGLAVVALAVIGLVALRYIAPLEFEASGDAARALVRRPIAPARASLLYLSYDLAALSLAALASCWLVHKVAREPVDVRASLAGAAIFVPCCFLGLRFAHAHTRRWMQASLHDFVEFFAWTGAAVLLSGGVLTLLAFDFSFRIGVFHLVAFSLMVPLLLAPRSIGVLVHHGLDTCRHRRQLRVPGHQGCRTLVYGAGDLSNLFFEHVRLSPSETWRDYSFVGIIDDHAGLHGRRFRGFRILGGIESLEEQVERHDIGCVIVASSVLPPARHAALEAAAARHRIRLLKWTPDLVPAPVEVDRQARPGEIPAALPAPRPVNGSGKKKRRDARRKILTAST